MTEVRSEERSSSLPVTECSGAHAETASRLGASSANGARGRDDPKPQDDRNVWVMSPGYNVTGASSWETIISSPHETGTSRDDPRARLVSPGDTSRLRGRDGGRRRMARD